MDNELEPVEDAGSVLPFDDLEAPAPLDSAPPPAARWLAFLGILVGGLLGGMIGWGVGEIMGGSSTWAAVGALLGGLTGAIGVGVVANLTLRAMNEWKAVEHPEDDRSDGKRTPTLRRRTDDKQWTRRPGT